MSEPTDQKQTRSTPTEKMVAAATRAAERHGVELPAEALKNFEACSEFLDKYLSLPSAKQISFAQKIAQTKGVKLPDSALKDAKEISAWIQANQ